MFTGSLTTEQLDGLFNIIKQTSEDFPDYLKHEDILESITLTWFQCMCVEHALVSKGTLCSLATGLGKTATSAGYVYREQEENPGKLSLFFCLPESLEQTLADYSSYLNKNIVAISGAASDVYTLINTPLNKIDVVIVSYEATYNIQFANWLTRNLDNVCCAVFDEVHMISQDSLVNSFCTQLCRRLKSKLFLSATPITVSPEQVIVLMNMLDEIFIPTGKKLLKPYEIRDPETFEVIDYKELDSLATSMYPRYISWDRKELGLQGNYKPHLLLVQPTEEQMLCSYNDIETVIKGQRNSNQMEVIKAVVQDRKANDKVGLIYCDTRANSDMLCEELRKIGIKAFVANGKAENKKIRNAVLKLFRQRDIDVVITNLTTSLNLDCDYVAFWENTNKAVQMLGRCERGFKIKDLDIYFILTENTVEVTQFSKNVYRRCKWLGEALSKDVTTFTKIQAALEKATQQNERGVR